MKQRLQRIFRAWRRPSVAAVASLLVCIWGCIAVFLATHHLPRPHWFVIRQAVWVVFGAVGFVAASAVSPERYRRLTPFLVILAQLLLLLVLVFGIRINGMRGWFAYQGVFLQPSEVSKPVFILGLAAVMAWTQRYRGEFLRGFGIPVLYLLPWLLVLSLQPDFGAVLVYALSFAIVYWCMGGRTTHLLLSAGACVPACIFVLWRHRYVLDRIVGFLHPDAHPQTSGWHILQFRRTLAAGGWFGRSREAGLWSSAYLPLGYSDSIFASTAELSGFVGILPLILLIVAWVAYAHYHACRARNLWTTGVVMGLATLLGGQAFIHLSVNLGLLPPTGITLPLVSYGGSSLLATMVTMGVVESLVRDREGRAVDQEDPADRSVVELDDVRG